MKKYDAKLRRRDERYGESESPLGRTCAAEMSVEKKARGAAQGGFHLRRRHVSARPLLVRSSTKPRPSKANMNGGPTKDEW